MKKVLIVDDEALVARTYQRVLIIAGAITMYVTRPKEALELLETDPEIAVVLSDTLMPGMNGDKLHGEIQSRFAERGIVFIAMTGGCPQETRDYYQCHGIQVLEKPIDNDVLREAVRSALAS